MLPTSGGGLLGWLAENAANPSRIETKPSLGSVAESHRAELVGVLIDEITTHAEQARDRRSVHQFSVRLLLFE